MPYDTVLMPPNESLQDALEALQDQRDLHAQEVDDLLKLIEVKAGHIEKLDRAIEALTIIVNPPADAQEEGILTDIVDRVRTFRPKSATESEAAAPPQDPPAEPETGAEAHRQFERSLKSRVLEAIQDSGSDGITLAELSQRFPEGKMATLKVYLSQWLGDLTIVMRDDRYVPKARASAGRAAA